MATSKITTLLEGTAVFDAHMETIPMEDMWSGVNQLATYSMGAMFYVGYYTGTDVILTATNHVRSYPNKAPKQLSWKALGTHHYRVTHSELIQEPVKDCSEFMQSSCNTHLELIHNLVKVVPN